MELQGEDGLFPLWMRWEQKKVASTDIDRSILTSESLLKLLDAI